MFVICYGLDFQGRYRNISQMLVVQEVARCSNDPLLLVGSLFEGC